MKRLTKKSEFYDASNIYNKYVEFYINPNSTEIKQIYDLQKENGYDIPSIRMFINDSGRIYAWDGYILHSVAKDFLKDAQNDIHLAIENFGYIHSVGKRNRTQFVSAIKNAKQNLQNAGINENCALEEIFKSFGSQDDFSIFKTLKDIYDFEEEVQEKIARLIKKAEFYDADNLMNNMKCKKLYTEFYINPDKNDINKILKYQKEQTNRDFDGIRMFLNNNGRIYAWSAYVLHSNAKNFLKDASSDIHLAYDISSNEMSVDGLASWDETSFLNAFKNAKSNFEKAGINENCNLDIYYSFNNEFKTLKDVYNFELQEKIARLIKKASKIYLKDILDFNSIKIYGENTDYGNRDFAISYINGKLYDGETHKDTVTEYLNNKNQDPDEYLNYEEGFVTSDEQDNIDTPMGFASYVKGIDSKDYIAIYPDSLFNLSMDMFVSALQSKYSNAIICEDNNDRYNHYDDGTIFIETI
jgi:hypothetical protein